jgi:biotin synthase
MQLSEILYKENLSREEIIFLLSLEDKTDIFDLYLRADEVRKQYCGDEVHLRGIIEFSNYCEQDCLYCGLRLNNPDLERYRMSLEEIVDTAKTIYSFGIKTIVLQSGEDSYYSRDYVKDIITAVRNELDMAITLSLGERDFKDYEVWRNAGADRYLLKHETANSDLYSIYHLDQSLEERITHLRFLKSIGFQIGSGNLIGLPRQTIGDIADDIILCRELDVDMASISPFIPSPETPYRGIAHANVNFTLQTIAVTRIVLKNAHIPATTALATLDEHGREKGLQVGANVIMPNYTPMAYREKYKIYPNKKCVDENPLGCNDCLRQLIYFQGRTVSESQGHSLKR